MLTIEARSNKQKFEPHPAGPFAAVCADVFTVVQKNIFKGQLQGNGKVDDRDEVTNLCIAFLTTEMIEIDGVPQPRYAGFWASAKKGTVDYPSKVRDFIKGWYPKLTDEKFDAPDFDFEKLIGQGAYITVGHKTKKDGNIKAEVKGAMTPPAGMPIPPIPADFVRHKDKQAATAVDDATKAGADSIRNDNGDAPF